MSKICMRMAIYALGFIVLLVAIGPPPAMAEAPLALYNKVEDPMQRLFWRSAISCPDGRDMVFFWQGKVYLDIPGDAYAPPAYPTGQLGYPHGGGNGGTPIFGFVGYNIRRVVPHSDPARVGDFIQASRELVFYTWLSDGVDPASGERVKAGDIVTSWKNPLTGKIVPVYPITNEFLWEHYRVGTYFKASAYSPFDFSQYIDDGILRSVITVNYNPGSGCSSLEFDSPVGAPQAWASDYNWSFEVFPKYRLDDCGRWDIADAMNLKNDTYTSMEAFSFWVPKKTLHKVQRESARRQRSGCGSWLPKVNLNWVRIGSFPPWMGMYEGEATATAAGNGIEGFDGRIIYSVRSELLKSYHHMPADFRAKMATYFGEMNAQDLDTIGLKDNDGDGWEMAPSVYDPSIKRDTSYSVFYFKNLAPQGQTWVEWVAQNIPDQ